MKSELTRIVTLTAMAGLLAGCVSPNGRPDNTGTGALVGGASGAAIGALADRRNPGAGALIGGAAGLVAGGLIGHAVDQQQAAPPPATLVVAAPQPAAMSVADIKAMARAGVGDDIIINQINNTHAVFALDANTIVDLKTAGVSDKVLAYMMNTAANVVAAAEPPAPRTEVIVAAPSPEYVWTDGEWVWSGGTWMWVGGRWIMPPHPHAIWIGARWERGPHGWHRMGGHWR